MGKNSGNIKAQAWFTDFAIALFIFSFVLISYYAYTTNISKQDSVVLDDLVSDAKLVYSSVLLSGFPDDWYNATVQRIGLTNNNQRINESKLRYLKEIPYKKAKGALGTIYDFFLFLEDSEGNLINIGTKCGYGNANISVNKTFKLAAYFNQGTDEMEDEIEELEQKLGISIYRDWTSANDMLNNISAYDFVLMENPKFNPNQALQLEDYVQSGGNKANPVMVILSERVINEQSGDILGVNYQKRTKCKENTTVVHDDLFLTLNKGDVLAPDDCPYISGDVTTIAQFPDGKISIAKWPYGNGSVYYFSDFEVDFAGDLQGSIKDALEASISVCGKSTDISLEDIAYKNLVKTERFLIYDSKPVKMVLYLWQ